MSLDWLPVWEIKATGDVLRWLPERELLGFRFKYTLFILFPKWLAGFLNSFLSTPKFSVAWRHLHSRKVQLSLFYSYVSFVKGEKVSPSVRFWSGPQPQTSIRIRFRAPSGPELFYVSRLCSRTRQKSEFRLFLPAIEVSVLVQLFWVYYRQDSITKKNASRSLQETAWYYFKAFGTGNGSSNSPKQFSVSGTQRKVNFATHFVPMEAVLPWRSQLIALILYSIWLRMQRRVYKIINWITIVE